MLLRTRQSDTCHLDDVQAGATHAKMSQTSHKQSPWVQLMGVLGSPKHDGRDCGDWEKLLRDGRKHYKSMYLPPAPLHDRPPGLLTDNVRSPFLFRHYPAVMCITKNANRHMAPARLGGTGASGTANWSSDGVHTKDLLVTLTTKDVLGPHD